MTIVTEPTPVIFGVVVPPSLLLLLFLFSPKPSTTEGGREEVGSGGGSVVREHSPSLREEMTTEQLGQESSVTMILAPHLPHSSITEPLSLSRVTSSLARYVTCEGDSG